MTPSEKNCAYNKKWRKNNPEKVRASRKRYRERHPEKVREYTEKLSFKKKEEKWENTLIELGYGYLYKS